ncbi:MAG: GNAT family N-acetyltransferase [Pseudomonadota bacterium]
MIRFRAATSDDIGDIVALLADDVLGRGREDPDTAVYQRAFATMQSEAYNHLIVGQQDRGRVVATYQITFISGLSLRATRRAQIESVRVASDLRGTGIGGLMVEDMRTRARAAGCTLLQLTMNSTRDDARRFYVAHGFAPSHTGFKMTV